MVRFLLGANMKKYLIAAIVIIVAGAYFFGARIGRMQCETNTLNKHFGETINITSIKRSTDEKVFNTGMRDVRRILHTKYTIAE